MTVALLLSSRAPFRVLSVISVDKLACIMTVMPSDMKGELKHHSPKDGIVQRTRELTNWTERMLLNYLITSL